jgi:hypothetical protein
MLPERIEKNELGLERRVSALGQKQLERRRSFQERFPEEPGRKPFNNDIPETSFRVGVEEIRVTNLFKENIGRNAFLP